MKIFYSIVFLLAIVGCNQKEIESIKTQNVELKHQLDSIAAIKEKAEKLRGEVIRDFSESAEQLKDKMMEVESLEFKMNARNDTILSRNKTIDSLVLRLQHQESVVASSKENSSNQKDIITRKERDLNLQEAKLSQSESQIKNLNSIVTQRDASISSLNSVISQRDATIKNLNAAISQRDAEIQSLKTKLEKSN